jgi:hypothetical protein
MSGKRNNRSSNHKSKSAIANPSSQSSSDAEFLQDSGVPLIDAHTVQTLIQNEHSAEQLTRLIDADLSYNKQRLEIIREHALKHPDLIDLRKIRRYRRTQYAVLLALACALSASMPFVSLVVTAIFATITMLIVCGVLFNARDREMDSQGFLKLINIVIGRKK